jgi:hypothetical protein
MRHNFAVWPLRTNGGGECRTEVYHCVRCGWRFAVRGRLLAALDEHNHALAGAEGLERIASFAEGPCPAFPGESAKADR